MIEAFRQEPAYFLMAVICSSLFLFRFIIQFVGGDGDGALGDHGDPSGESFTILSAETVLAFLMGAGWTGLAARQEWELGVGWSAGVAAFSGLLTAGLSLFLTNLTRKLNHATPAFDPSTAVGATGNVYLRIPAHGQGAGQIQLDLQGRREILDARSTGDAIESFQLVRIVAIESDIAVVEPIQS